MGAGENRKLMEDVFGALTEGNDALFIEAMADDMRWIWMGSGRWSRVFEGKQAILNDLWSAVRATLAPPYKVTAQRFIAEGDHVAIEATGSNTTRDGRQYENRYCWVCELSGGKIHELREYMDTELVTSIFKEEQQKN